MYGYLLADALIFVSGVGLLRRKRSTPTLLFATGIGVTLLSDAFQDLAYGNGTNALSKAFEHILSYEIGVNGMVFLPFLSMLGMVVSAIGLLAFVSSKKRSAQDTSHSN